MDGLTRLCRCSALATVDCQRHFWYWARSSSYFIPGCFGVFSHTRMECRAWDRRIL